jgi:hypothetical protein
MKMPRFGLARRFRGGVLFVGGLALLVACHGPALSDSAADEAAGQEPVAPCAEDEVREYFCDDLQPLSSSRPAPAPYDNCPASTDIRHASFPAVGRIANFDPGFTGYTRKRVPPGHSCCYGWCAKVTVAEPTKAAPSACHDASGLQETFCMREFEGGTSAPAGSPFEHCPVAVKPPEVAAFSVPNAALLEVNLTGQRRRDMQLADCCYAWCSKAPAGTVLKATHPKTK